MLVDLEPGYETFDVGDRIEPTTMWIDREAIPGGIPGPLVGGVPARIEAAPESGRYGWLHLAPGFVAALPAWSGAPGPALVRDGMLLYDRYLWISGESRPGSAVVLERAELVRDVTHRPTRHPNWYTPEYHGDNRLAPYGPPPEGTDITWYCVRIGIPT